MNKYYLMCQICLICGIFGTVVAFMFYVWFHTIDALPALIGAPFLIILGLWIYRRHKKEIEDEAGDRGGI